MQNVYEVLNGRGFIEQVTDEELISERFAAGRVSCYIGFDPTAASLHIGSLVPIMALMHLQRAGHLPIVLVGGGTALIGDPSGKTEMRKLLTAEQISHNEAGLKRQLSRYLDFSPPNGAIVLNNADWLTPMRYIDFLRDIGKHFSVNKMLAAESYRVRMEKGLNFIEFNYMLLQAYDFLHLFTNRDCILQLGGNDQWGNILAGIDLIRRVNGGEAFGVTFPLLTTAAGNKMGKTERGTVWLDPKTTSPYDFYQYWVNVADADLRRFLLLFTFLPAEEIDHLTWQDHEINLAKTVLAFEATKITHGESSSLQAWRASSVAFGTAAVPKHILPSSSIPRLVAPRDISALFSVEKTEEELSAGIPVYRLLVETRLCSSYSEARRVIVQGGAYVNDAVVKMVDEVVGTHRIGDNGEILLRKGKKNHAVVKITKN